MGEFSKYNVKIVSNMNFYFDNLELLYESQRCCIFHPYNVLNLTFGGFRSNLSEGSHCKSEKDEQTKNGPHTSRHCVSLINLEPWRGVKCTMSLYKALLCHTLFVGRNLGMNRSLRLPFRFTHSFVWIVGNCPYCYHIFPTWCYEI